MKQIEAINQVLDDYIQLMRQRFETRLRAHDVLAEPILEIFDEAADDLHKRDWTVEEELEELRARMVDGH